MIHYNVWFTLKDGVGECHGLAVIEDFLRGLCGVGEVAAFRLLQNNADGTRTKLPRFQAIVEFSDEAALGRAMKNQVERGIHRGGHGQVIDVVSEFRVEIFRLLESVGAMSYACEI